MIPAFVIHHSEATDRADIVKALVEKTNATIVEAVWVQDRKQGCRHSHLKVALLAKELVPESPYLVFEDDCILTDQWKQSLDSTATRDLVYLGYNDRCEHTIFGTHALIVSPRLRDILIQETEDLIDNVRDRGAFDHILSLLCSMHSIVPLLPFQKDVYCYQQKGLVSSITGKKRM